MIYVSFCQPPNVYPSNPINWAQISHFVYKGLKKKYGQQVEFIPFDSAVPFTDQDILITHIPNTFALSGIRVIYVDNDNFEIAKWKQGRFNKYGYNHPIDHTFQYNHFFHKNVICAFLKTNDVAIKKWNSNHPDVVEKKNFLMATTQETAPIPHPIDRKFFSRLFDPSRKFERNIPLIYHDGERKDSSGIIKCLVEMGYKQENDFVVMQHINKNSQQEIESVLSRHLTFMSGSFSEGFPYMANEFMVQGMLLFAHEEWWDGYGNEKLLWSYDPEKLERNKSNLEFLMNPANICRVVQMRDEMRELHLNREDNTWDFFCNELFKRIEA